MTTPKHPNQTDINVHTPFRWIFADAAAKAAEVVTADDVEKVAWQQDTNAIYVLEDAVPTWTLIGIGAVALADLTDVDLTGLADGDILIYDSGSGTWVVIASDEHIISDAVTAAVSPAVTLKHNTSGTAAANFGTGIDFEADDDTNPDQPIGTLEFAWSDPTNGAVYSRPQLYAMANSVKHLRAILEAPDTEPASDGNARGAGAVDLQSDRNNATEVASGDYSSILGGQENSASGDYSAVVNGKGVIASNQGQIAGNSGWYFASPGDIQGTYQIVVGGTETHGSTTWRDLYIDGSSSFIAVPTDTIMIFFVQIVGLESGAIRHAAYQIRGAIKNDGGSTTMPATSVQTTITASLGYDVQAVANDGDDTLRIQVRDTTASGNTVRWAARVEIMQVTFP